MVIWLIWYSFATLHISCWRLKVNRINFYKIFFNWQIIPILYSHIIRNINDPEHPLTLEQLNVVEEKNIDINDKTSYLKILFTPTIPHCSMATLIGLSIRVLLLRSLPVRYKVKFLFCFVLADFTACEICVCLFFIQQCCRVHMQTYGPWKTRTYDNPFVGICFTIKLQFDVEQSDLGPTC